MLTRNWQSCLLESQGEWSGVSLFKLCFGRNRERNRIWKEWETRRQSLKEVGYGALACSSEKWSGCDPAFNSSLWSITEYQIKTIQHYHPILEWWTASACCFSLGWCVQDGPVASALLAGWFLLSSSQQVRFLSFVPCAVAVLFSAGWASRNSEIPCYSDVLQGSSGWRNVSLSHSLSPTFRAVGDADIRDA